MQLAGGQPAAGPGASAAAAGRAHHHVRRLPAAQLRGHGGAMLHEQGPQAVVGDERQRAAVDVHDQAGEDAG